MRNLGIKYGTPLAPGQEIFEVISTIHRPKHSTRCDNWSRKRRLAKMMPHLTQKHWSEVIAFRAGAISALKGQGLILKQPFDMVRGYRVRARYGAQRAITSAQITPPTAWLQSTALDLVLRAQLGISNTPVIVKTSGRVFARAWIEIGGTDNSASIWARYRLKPSEYPEHAVLCSDGDYGPPQHIGDFESIHTAKRFITETWYKRLQHLARVQSLID